MKGTRSLWLSAALAASLLLTPATVLAENKDQLTPGEHKILQQLTKMSGGTIQIRWDDERGTPRFLSGKLSNPMKGEPLANALAFLDAVRELYHFDKAKKTFRLKRIDRDELGMTHVRLTHVSNNIPVWGDELIVHFDKEGVVRSINGQFTPKIEEHTAGMKKPTLIPGQAVEKALKEVGVDKPARKPTAMLYFFPHPDPDTVTLVYVVSVYDPQKPADWRVFVDAINGDVVYKYNDLKTTAPQESKKQEPPKQEKQQKQP
jgi:bacillolysin